VKKVLVIDIGGTNVRFLATGYSAAGRFVSGQKSTAKEIVEQIKRQTADCRYEVVSIGYPEVVRHRRAVSEPKNLGRGRVGFDFQAAFRRPVKLINDAAMQALGSYRGGLMLFVGLGAGVGSALIADGVVFPATLQTLKLRE
jgi:predicted NBD/HSP70 family sugar kinase